MVPVGQLDQTVLKPAPVCGLDLPAELAGLWRLFEVMGPGLRLELLARLLDDFKAVQAGVTVAVAQLDHDALRNHSHILIALAGAVGADVLQAAAVSLNAVARRADDAAALELVQDVLPQITGLLGQLAHVAARLARVG